MSNDIDGFAYISASHNPIGYNGFKFGLSDGSVLAAEDSGKLMYSFNELIRNQHAIAKTVDLIHTVQISSLASVYDNTDICKAATLKAYRAFSRIVVTDSDIPEDQEKIFCILEESIQREPIGICAELNGSARTLSIDETFLKSIGAKVKRINGKPREFAHAILPEGESLTMCKNELERLHAQDPAFLLGYVPDNDGDRGNIVYIDTATKQAHILDSQEVFALACVAELAFLDYSEGLVSTVTLRQKAKRAIVVNDPTSLRIERIARVFGVKVFRAEVGEANVVNLARDLRKSGFTVRILGEGSNGGNITHPAAVRDPLNTIFAFIKLLRIKDSTDRKGLFRLWCEKSGQNNVYKEDFGINDILDTLPKFTTTRVYEPRAMINLKTQNHGLLKAKYEEIFIREWDEKKDYLEAEFGIHSYSEINYEGLHEIHGFGKTYRSGKERGGFKILFKNARGEQVAFIWMRGSGTEPVFRVLADTEGDDPAKEAWLLDWHRAMIQEADDSITDHSATRKEEL
jgi:phosphomannomutase